MLWAEWEEDPLEVQEALEAEEDVLVVEDPEENGRGVVAKLTLHTCNGQFLFS